MRIISQNGAIDVPYDYFSLTITRKFEDMEVACIYCHNLSSPKGTKLAEYSSKEKAEKLRKIYSDSFDEAYIEEYEDSDSEDIRALFIYRQSNDNVAIWDFNENEKVDIDGNGDIYAIVSAKDEEHARKKGQDMIAKYKAEKLDL